MKQRLFDPWGSVALTAFTLAVTLMAVYGFLAFGGGFSGFIRLP